MAALFISFCLSGCAPKPVQVTETPPPPLPDAERSKLPAGKFGGRLITATFGDPKTFNFIVAEESSSTQVLELLFEGMVGKDRTTQEITPALATSWEVGADQKTFTYHLRKGVYWNDGTPFTADDVLFTFNDLVYNKDIPNRYIDSLSVDGKPFQLEKIDSHTVRFVSPEIFSPFLEFVGGFPILPKHKLEKAVKEGSFLKTWGINTPGREIVATGPFRIRSYQPGQRTVFERNPYYWRLSPDGQRLPYLDYVILSIVRDMNAMFLNFISGQSDVSELDDPTIRPEDYFLARRFEKVRDFTVTERGPSSSTGFFWFNQNPGSNSETQKPFVAPHKLAWFKEKRFRQACSYAIDRQGIIDSIYYGMAVPLWSCESISNVRWFNPNVRQYPRDLAKARKLLEEAGFKLNADQKLTDAKGNLVEFDLLTNQGNNVRANLANVIKDNLRELGMVVNVRPIDFNLLVSKITDTYEYECCLLGLGGGAEDPTSGQAILLSSGRMHQWYPLQKSPATPWEARIDELMRLQVKTIDYPTRKKYYDEVQAIMAEEQPYIYLVTPQLFSGIHNKWQNLQPPASSLGSSVWNLDEIWPTFTR